MKPAVKGDLRRGPMGESRKARRIQKARLAKRPQPVQHWWNAKQKEEK